MRLPLQRDRQRGAPRDPRSGGGDAVGGEFADEAVAAARVKARRRLVGAAVLLGAGVLGFPMLFETEPRPLPANLPIVTAQGEVARPAAEADPAGAPGLAPASAPENTRVAPPSLPASAAASKPSPAPAAPAAASAPGGTSTPPAPARAQPPTSTPPPPTSTPPPTTTPPPPAAERAAKPPASAPAAESAAEGRFVVQVGAYADATTLRATRQQVEKLGLKTYTQVVDSDAGQRTRVRVGPFKTRAEAQAAAARLKAAGLPANLLAL